MGDYEEAPRRPVLGHAVAATLMRVLNRPALAQANVLEQLLLDVAKEAEMDVVGKIMKQFTPEGATCVLLLAESHLAVHTWPEHAMATVEIFSCVGKGQAQHALRLTKEKFNSSIIKLVEFVL